ncbi:hypothetical protein M0811_11139 [Anaeramoeba ignava]|uniref:F-box domain-containing protein n=1 Tax=Anaeramoeba ignava TaxID=1746090 RepID=A0A9Q0LCQ4_ANAIG|nr:hypothetical protein M0811_11139 [Anaeramoeba ignava]
MNLNKNKKTPYYEIIQIYSNITYTNFIKEIYPTSKANKILNYIEKDTYNYTYNQQNNNYEDFSDKNIDLYSDINLNFIQKEKEKEKEIDLEIERKEENESYFDWLPEELILMIFEYLDKPIHLCICEATCSQFQRISNEPILWKNALRKTAPYLDFLMAAGYAYRYQTRSFYFSFKGVIGICKYFEEEHERLLKQKEEEKINYDGKEKEKENPLNNKINELVDNHIDLLFDDSYYDTNYYPNQNSKNKLYQHLPYDQFNSIYAYRVIKRDYKFFDSHPYPPNPQKIDKALKIFEGGVVPILFSLSFLIAIILSMLKLDLIIETNCVYIFLPVEISFCCLLYIGFCFYMTRDSRDFYHFTISMIISVISTIIFLILLSIKLEYSNSFPWFILLIPHLISFGAWIYFPVTTYRKIREEDDYLKNIMLSYILIFNIPITTFMILFILYKQNISGITQNSIFIPLFIIDILPTVLFIFWPIYLRYCRKHTDSWKSVRNLPSTYNSYLKINFISLFIYQIPMLILFIQELLIYLKLNQKIFIEWITVSTPSIISFGFIFDFWFDFRN